MAKKIVEGLWDCQYCDTKGIRGRERICPSCGKPRGEGVKFYLPKDGKDQEAVSLTEDEKLPDWQCAYCGSYNKATNTKCYRCEAPKDGKDYFELHKDIKESSQSRQHVDTNKKCPYCGVENPAEAQKCSNCGAFFQNNKKAPQNNTKKKGDLFDDPAGAIRDFLISIWELLLKFLKFLLRHPVLLGFGLAFAVTAILIISESITHEYVAEDFSWDVTIDFEEYRTVEESDWYLPEGARLKYTRQEIHHYTKNDTAFPDPFLKVVYADDLGNGYFEVDDGGGWDSGGWDSGGSDDWSFDDNDTSEPVYRTKYYYEIDRWIVTRTVSQTGYDKEPFEPEFTLMDGERRGETYYAYYVYASREGDDPEYYEISEEAFYALEYGQTFLASGDNEFLEVELSE